MMKIELWHLNVAAGIENNRNKRSKQKWHAHGAAKHGEHQSRNGVLFETHRRDIALAACKRGRRRIARGAKGSVKQQSIINGHENSIGCAYRSNSGMADA